MTERKANPKIVAIAERNKAFSAERAPAFEKQIQNATNVTAALEEIEREILIAKARGDLAVISTLEAKLDEYARLRSLEAAAARAQRKNEPSPFTAFFRKMKRRNPQAKNVEIKDQLIAAAENGDFGAEFVVDGDTIVHVETQKSLRISSIASAISQALNLRS